MHGPVGWGGSDCGGGEVGAGRGGGGGLEGGVGWRRGAAVVGGVVVVVAVLMLLLLSVVLFSHTMVCDPSVSREETGSKVTWGRIVNKTYTQNKSG